MDRLDLDSQGKLSKKIAYPRHSSLLAPTTVDAGPHHLLETAVVHPPTQVVEQLTSHAENTFHRCRGGRAAQELARHHGQVGVGALVNLPPQQQVLGTSELGLVVVLQVELSLALGRGGGSWLRRT